MKLHRNGGVVGSLFLLVACSSPAPSGGTAADPNAFCGAYCARSQACDDTTNLPTCVNACINDNAAILPKLRADVASSMESCLGAEDCGSILGGDSMSACLDEATAATGPDPLASRFCDDLASVTTACGNQLDVASCLNAAKIFSDSTLAGAESCTTQACPQIADCVAVSFGETDSGASGSGSGSGS
jgi:hypothetical protein